MLLNMRTEEGLFTAKKKLKFFAAGIALFVFIQIAYLIFYTHPGSNINKQVEMSIKAGTIEQIGRELYTNYILPFEAAGFLLLAATIGALVLAKKKFEGLDN
jgi:NADH-quinone oxidoreductase subunit J